MHTLTRHGIFHSDGRRLLIDGELRGSLGGEPAPEAPQAIHKRLDLFTEDAASSRSGSTVPGSCGTIPPLPPSPDFENRLSCEVTELDWHLAFELYPPCRTAGVTKIRAGVEAGLGLFLNDVAPEDAASRLAGLTVAAEPIELDVLFAVAAQPHLVPLP